MEEGGAFCGAPASFGQSDSSARYDVTAAKDCDCFRTIYFHTPGGILSVIATSEHGFARDKGLAHLGQALGIPDRHAHLRGQVEKLPTPLID